MTILPVVHVLLIDRLTRSPALPTPCRMRTRLSRSKRQARDARGRKRLTTSRYRRRHRILIYKTLACPTNCFDEERDPCSDFSTPAPKAPNCLRSWSLSALPAARIFSICRFGPLSSSSKHIARACRNINQPSQEGGPLRQFLRMHTIPLPTHTMKRFVSTLKRRGSDEKSSRVGGTTALPQGDAPEAVVVREVTAFCESGGPDSENAGDEYLHLPAIVDAAESSPAAAKEAAVTIRGYLSKVHYARGYAQ